MWKWYNIYRIDFLTKHFWFIKKCFHSLKVSLWFSKRLSLRIGTSGNVALSWGATRVFFVRMQWDVAPLHEHETFLCVPTHAICTYCATYLGQVSFESSAKKNSLNYEKTSFLVAPLQWQKLQSMGHERKNKFLNRCMKFVSNLSQEQWRKIDSINFAPLVLGQNFKVLWAFPHFSVATKIKYTHGTQMFFH